MTVFIKKIRRICYIIKGAEVGFATQKSWPGKSQWGYYHFYYDRHYYGFHCGPLYICSSI